MIVVQQDKSVSQAEIHRGNVVAVDTFNATIEITHTLGQEAFYSGTVKMISPHLEVGDVVAIIVKKVKVP